MNEKRVITVVEKGVNYIFHTLSVAKIGYDSDYAEAYKDSINKKDLDFLILNKSFLEFANGNSGQLTWLYIFLPCKLNLDTEDKINEYFDLLVESIKIKNTKKFYERYKVDIIYLEKMWGQWWEYCVLNNIEGTGLQCSEEAERIANIIKNNFRSYEKCVWPKEEEKMKKVSEEVTKIINNMNIISDIEKIMGLTYEEEFFKIALCSANGNGPDANDLGYNKNLHFYGRSIEGIIHFAVHEIIIRLIIPIRNKLCMEHKNVDSETIYKAVEMLAEFYTVKVLNDGIKMEWYKEFLELYEATYKKDSAITIENLLTLGFNYKKMY